MEIYENTQTYLKRVEIRINKYIYIYIQIYSCRKHMPCMGQARPGDAKGGWVKG